MRAMNEAIEVARDFRGMMDKIEAGAAQKENALRLLQAAMQDDTPDERSYSAMPDRRPGENRAAHRARLKAERRATLPAAVGARLEPGVGRPVDEATDTSGPRGTYGCACVADSARLCTVLRYGRDIDSREQHDDDCECLCHQWSDDDDEYH